MVRAHAGGVATQLRQPPREQAASRSGACRPSEVEAGGGWAGQAGAWWVGGGESGDGGVGGLWDGVGGSVRGTGVGWYRGTGVGGWGWEVVVGVLGLGLALSFSVRKDHPGSSRDLTSASLGSCFRQILWGRRPPGLPRRPGRVRPRSQDEPEPRETHWDWSLIIMTGNPLAGSGKDKE